MLIDAVLPGGERARDGLRRGARRGRVRRQPRRRSSARRIDSAAGRYVAIALAGTIGYLLGSLLGWAIGVYGGRPLLERRGRWLHLTPEKLDRAEALVRARGDWAVFIGRLTPVVRSFISIPAGVFRSPLGRYTVLTAARLGDLVLRLRRRRLGVRNRILGGVPRGLPLASTTLSSLVVASGSRRGCSSAADARPRMRPPCRRFRSLTSRRSTRR